MKASVKFPDLTQRWKDKFDGNPVQLAQEVLDCTRRIHAGYFQPTAKDGNEFRRLGAPESMLTGLVTMDPPWDAYLGGMQLVETGDASLQDGPYLHFDDDSSDSEEKLVTFYGKRTIAGYVPSHPSVYQVLYCLMGPWPDSGRKRHIPVTLLWDWYRADLRRTYELDDTEQFIMFLEQWVRDVSTRSGTCQRGALMELGVSAGKHYELPPDQAKKWTAGLIETLERLRILQLPGSGAGDYRVTFRADPSVILNAIFARSTGDARLDDLLFGGLVIPDGSRLSNSGEGKLAVSITGPPGFGKTCIALSIGVQTAARGGICLYLRLSQEAGSISRQIRSFYRSKLDFIEVATRSQEVPGCVESCARSSKGLLWIDSISSSPEEMRRKAFELVKEGQPSARFFADKEKLIVFDSIGLASITESQREEWRKFFIETTSWLRALGYSVIYVVERDQDRDSRFEEFLVDLGIRLQPVRSTHGNSYIYRTLEVTKSRHQLVHRGQHTFAIQADAGVRVSLSSAAILAARRRSEKPPRPKGVNAIVPGIKGFARYLGGLSWYPPREEVPYWTKESVTALIGPAGTNKHLIAENFIDRIDAVKPEDVPGCNLVIHFADEDETVVADSSDQRRTRLPLAGLLYSEPAECKTTHRKYQKHHFVFRSSHVGPGPILDSLQEFMRELRHSQTSIDRAVVRDTANIAASFPGLHPSADPIFLAALCDLLVSNHVTVLLVHSGRHTDERDETLMQIRDLAETIIVTEPRIDRGHSCVSIHVGRSRDGSHNRGIYELKVNSTGAGSEKDKAAQGSGTVRECEITNTFDMVANVRADVLRPGQVHLSLDAGTELQYRFFQSLRTHFQLLNLENHRMTIRPPEQAFSRRAIAPGLITLHEDLRLVQRESAQLPSSPLSLEPHEIDMYQERIEPLWSSSKDWERRTSALIHCDGANGQPLWWVPYYANPSFLCARADFVQFAESHGYSVRFSAMGEEPAYSWSDLIVAARAFQETRLGEGQEPLVLFDFVDETPETLNCLFLEIAASLGPVNFHDFANNFDQRMPHFNTILEATLLLRTLLTPVWTGASILGPWKENRKANSGDQPAVSNSKAIFSRQWYSSYRQMLSDGGNSGSSASVEDFKLLRLPGGVWGDGDWGFMLLKGSLGVETAANLVLEYFIRNGQSQSMMAHGVGLTPVSEFYERTGILPSSGVAPRWFAPYIGHGNSKVIRRSRIRGYERMGPILSAHLAFILALPSSGSEEEVSLTRAKLHSCFKLLPTRRFS
jgi:KaiC/GvpD/RAD55 family RecA-like ATPase